MLEDSSVKQRVVNALMHWNYNATKASPFFIAKQIKSSESMVVKVLRYLKDEEIVEKTRHGSWKII